GHGRDLAQLEDAAAVADVALQDVDQVVAQQRPDVRPAVVALAGRERYLDRGADPGEHLGVLGRARLFEEEQADRLEGAGEPDRRGGGRPAPGRPYRRCPTSPARARS